MASRIIKHCDHCDAQITVKPSRADRTKYCSMDCYNANRATPLCERFWKSVERGGEDECWLWRGAIASGYGTISLNGRGIGAHRASYLLHKGEIDKGLVVMHSCDTPLCVNPWHLSVGTYSDNVQDMLNKGRSNSSEETRRKKSIASRGRVVSEEARAKIAASAKLGGRDRMRAALLATSKSVVYKGNVFGSKAELRRHLGGVHSRVVDRMIAEGEASYANRQ